LQTKHLQCCPTASATPGLKQPWAHIRQCLWHTLTAVKLNHYPLNDMFDDDFRGA